MAFDTIRNVLGQMALQRAAQRTPQAQAELAGTNLRNQMMQLQMDKLMPLQIDQLRKQIDFMVSPEESMRNAMSKEIAKNALQASLEKLKSGLSGERQMAVEQLRARNAQDLARIPRTVVNLTPNKGQAFPLGALTGKYTPESIAKYRASVEAGAPDESLLLDKPKAATQPAQRYMLESQRQELSATLSTTGEFETLKTALINMPSNKRIGLFGIDWMAADAAPFKNDSDLVLQLQATNFPDGPQWRSLGTPDQLRKQYPVISQSVDRMRGLGPTQATLEASTDNLRNINGATFRINPDGSATRIQ